MIRLNRVEEEEARNGYKPELVREHVYSRGKFVKKANHLANYVQVNSNSKKSDVAKFATYSEPI